MSENRPSLPELGERLAFLTALEKVVKKQKADVRFEFNRHFANLAELTDADSVTLKVGGERVGKVSLTKPRPSVLDPDAFGKWAYETGVGHRRLVINLDESPASDAEILGTYAQSFYDDFGGTAVHIEYKADDFATSDLEVKRGKVVSKTTGEIVPGTAVRDGYMHVSGCNPAEVGEAMRLAGDSTTVAGLLGGDVNE